MTVDNAVHASHIPGPAHAKQARAARTHCDTHADSNRSLRILQTAHATQLTLGDGVKWKQWIFQHDDPDHLGS